MKQNKSTAFLKRAKVKPKNTPDAFSLEKWQCNERVSAKAKAWSDGDYRTIIHKNMEG